MSNLPSPYSDDLLAREVVLSRVIEAPRSRVFQAWVDPERMFRWFGPRGFHCVVHQQGPAVPGAVWRFDMIGPDGTRYDNRMVFVQVLPDERLVIEHGSDRDADPNRFMLTLSFDAQGDGKTVLTLRQLHPSRARRDGVIGFGAVEMGYQTLDKLAAYVGGH